MWNRPHLPTLQSQDLAWTPTDDDHIGGGALRKILSIDLDDQAESSLVQIVTPRRGLSNTTIDLFVLEGVGLLNGTRVAPNHYCTVRPGDVIDLVPTAPRMVLLVMSFGRASLLPGDDGPVPEVVDIDDLEWAQPEWNGDATVTNGALVKWLRRDDLGVLYYSAKLPGWYHTVDEWHPHHEESFRVYGDNMMGDVVSGPGSYFFRPPEIWHGPLFTRTGTTSYIRADVATVTTTRPIAGPDVHTRRRAAYEHLGHPALQPWSAR